MKLAHFIVSLILFVADYAFGGCSGLTAVNKQFKLVRQTPLSMSCEDKSLRTTGQKVETAFNRIEGLDGEGKTVELFGSRADFSKFQDGDQLEVAVEDACCENIYSIRCSADGKPQDSKSISSLHSVSCHENRTQFLTNPRVISKPRTSDCSKIQNSSAYLECFAKSLCGDCKIKPATASLTKTPIGLKATSIDVEARSVISNPEIQPGIYANFRFDKTGKPLSFTLDRKTSIYGFSTGRHELALNGRSIAPIILARRLSSIFQPSDAEIRSVIPDASGNFVSEFKALKPFKLCGHEFPKGVVVTTLDKSETSEIQIIEDLDFRADEINDAQCAVSFYKTQNCKVECGASFMKARPRGYGAE